MHTDQPLTDNERLLPPHLGGHFGNTNMDEATLDYLIGRYDIKTMLDVGCGPGGMVRAARDRGIAAHGIDGDPFMKQDYVTIHDYTRSALIVGHMVGFDLIWCTEFVEHVEAQYQDNYLTTFDAGRVLFLTAAPPGFPGWHHVHCQPAEYWISLLQSRGWSLDLEATEWVRAHGGHVFSQRQGLVFVKNARSS